VFDALAKSYDRQSRRVFGSTAATSELIWLDPHFNEKLITARHLEPTSIKQFHGRQEALLSWRHELERQRESLASGAMQPQKSSTISQAKPQPPLTQPSPGVKSLQTLQFTATIKTTLVNQ
jgi:hypothetical protein